MVFRYFPLFFMEVFLMVILVHGETDIDRIEAIIIQWAPLVWLAPQEKFLPISVDEFLNNVNVAVREDTPKSESLPFGPDSEPFYLVTKNNLESLLKDSSSFIYGKNPAEHKVSVYAVVTGCSPNLSFRVSDANALGNTISVVYKQINSNPHFYVTFWIFYPFNEGKEVCFLGKVPTPIIFGSCIGKRKIIGNHVGDWEHVSLSFQGNPYPSKLYISVHDAGAYYRYEPVSNLFKYEKQVTKGIMQRPKFPPVVKTQKGHHPVLFSAFGSHGMWSAPGEHYYVRVPRLFDKNGYGTAWETWKNLEFIYLDLGKAPFWIKYKGRWGNPQQNCFLINKLGICEFSDGPRGITGRKQDFYCFREV